MSVVLENDIVTITLTAEVAGRLLLALGAVADNTKDQTIDRLCVALDYVGVSEVGAAYAQKNLMFDPDGVDVDPFTHNIVLED
jgi:hypothetical protein